MPGSVPEAHHWHVRMPNGRLPSIVRKCHSGPALGSRRRGSSSRPSRRLGLLHQGAALGKIRHGPRATARVDRRATTTPNLTVPSHYRAVTATAPTPRQGTTGRAQLSPRQPTDVGPTHIGGAVARAGWGPPHPPRARGDNMIDVMSRLGEVKVKTAEALRASEAD